MTMTLRAFMDTHALTTVEMAKRLKCSEGAVRKWYYGQRMPRPDQMRRISELTLGIVTADAFIKDVPADVSMRQRNPRGR